MALPYSAHRDLTLRDSHAERIASRQRYGHDAPSDEAGVEGSDGRNGCAGAP